MYKVTIENMETGETQSLISYGCDVEICRGVMERGSEIPVANEHPGAVEREFERHFSAIVRLHRAENA